ncbi:MAG: Gmad2 immunoglobulin-like domain-containing protein [Candidatus Wildermuthbacteria bacterium]|nr:Gmad2 immunoglobulin-like domain-containing protein [Candidatus Wildermuthbacteria bacterium]
MKRYFFALFLLGVVSVISIAGYFFSQSNSVEEVVLGNALEKFDLIRVSIPESNDVVESPLRIEGKARGGWFFEASFPVRAVDQNGNILGAGIAQAQGDWMTEEFVPFQMELEFKTPETKQGAILFVKDNPSGLPEHDDELRVPIRFK